MKNFLFIPLTIIEGNVLVYVRMNESLAQIVTSSLSASDKRYASRFVLIEGVIYYTTV